MKQTVSPAVAAIIVVVVVAVLGLFGYKLFFKPNPSAGKPPPEAEKWLNPGKTMRMPASGGPPGMPGGSVAPGGPVGASPTGAPGSPNGASPAGGGQ